MFFYYVDCIYVINEGRSSARSEDKAIVKESNSDEDVKVNMAIHGMWLYALTAFYAMASVAKRRRRRNRELLALYRRQS